MRWLLLVVCLSGCLDPEVPRDAATEAPAPDGWVTDTCSVVTTAPVRAQFDCDLVEMFGPMGDYERLEANFSWGEPPATALSVTGQARVDDCSTPQTLCVVASQEADPADGSMLLVVERPLLERHASAFWALTADVEGASVEMRFDVTVRVLPLSGQA